MMRVIGGNRVGRIRVEFELINGDDMALARQGLLPKKQVRRRKITGVVDPRSMRLVLPQSVVKELGLPLNETMNVRSADGRQEWRLAEVACIRLMGRDGTFSAVVEPKRRTAVIGYIVLEGLDLLVDCKHEQLIPRYPSGPVFEIE